MMKMEQLPTVFNHIWSEGVYSDTNRTNVCVTMGQ